MKKTIIVDFDDTLVDTEGGIRQFFIDKKLISEEEIVPRENKDWGSMFPTIDSEKIGELVWKKHSYEIFHPNYMKEIKDSTLFLSLLKGINFRIVLATYNPFQHYVYWFVESKGWSGYFDEIVIGKHKGHIDGDFLIDDDPSMIMENCDRFKCIMVKNSYNFKWSVKNNARYKHYFVEDLLASYQYL
jgi:5'(3')-deoxyribonucleotidase